MKINCLSNLYFFLPLIKLNFIEHSYSTTVYILKFRRVFGRTSGSIYRGRIDMLTNTI